MKIVLDTNVFVAAGFNPSSSSGEILRLVEQGAFDMVWHEATRRETRRLIEQIPGLAWERVAGLFRPELEHADELATDAFGFIADRDDRKFAALGEASGGVIVTNDDDLLSQRDRLQVRVLRPRELMAEYRREAAT